ncbi:uncharacterized protein LOC130742989 [Lotus japonicus]|uniref:uncharacterized protein LOC130742989 n=1 Tax=Lotus japonicus TaxID=34305 RepID=UPI00258FFED0|nr:uncharacterized protein LOC130742989 [Lotus japonicus]
MQQGELGFDNGSKKGLGVVAGVSFGFSGCKKMKFGLMVVVRGFGGVEVLFLDFWCGYGFSMVEREDMRKDLEKIPKSIIVEFDAKATKVITHFHSNSPRSIQVSYGLKGSNNLKAKILIQELHQFQMALLNNKNALPDLSRLEPFDGTNFKRWSQKLLIFFEQLEIDYVLFEDPPQVPIGDDVDPEAVTNATKKLELYEKYNKLVCGSREGGEECSICQSCSPNIIKIRRVKVRWVVAKFLRTVQLARYSYRGAQFTSHFWRSFQTALGTRLKMSTAFHPQTDGQSERTIQILEDMLRACVLDLRGSWDQYLSLMEFAYNNSYRSSIQMAPFEALYGRRCRSPIGWFEVGEAKLVGPELIQDAIEKIKLVRDCSVTAQSRQKSYVDRRRRPLEFAVADHVFLRVSPMKGVLRFGKKGKLSPRSIGPFEVLERVGSVSYRLALPPDLSAVHPVFHVSMLRKYLYDPSHVIRHEDVQLDDHLSYTEHPVAIVDRQVKCLRSKDVGSVKVLWRGPSGEEATWESEDIMREKYPHLFESQDSTGEGSLGCREISEDGPVGSL